MQAGGFTYATATLWAREAAWAAWREGGGKNAHAASRESGRTPVLESVADPPLLPAAGNHACR